MGVWWRHRTGDAIGIPLFIAAAFLGTAAFGQQTEMPGTKVHIDLPPGFIRAPASSIYMNGLGGAIQVMDISGSLPSVRAGLEEELAAGGIGQLPGGYTVEGVRLEELDGDRLYLAGSMQVRGMPAEFCALLTGNDLEVVFVIGFALSVSGRSLDPGLVTAVRSASWDYARTRNFESLLFYEIAENDVVSIQAFFGDRFLYRFSGMKYSDLDSVDIQIGSYLHTNNVVPEQYRAAAYGFAFRPPFDQRSLRSVQVSDLSVGGIEGARIRYTFVAEDGRTVRGIEYDLFVPYRVLFLRLRVSSDQPDRYISGMEQWFRTFRLK